MTECSDKGVRPNNLRHTFAIDHLFAGTPLGDVQGFLGHRQIETTRKFYAPILVARLRKSIGRRKLKLVLGRWPLVSRT